MNRFCVWIIGFLILAGAQYVNLVRACTDVVLPRANDSVPLISARNMDFDLHFHTYLIKIPQGYSMKSSPPHPDAEALQWETTYGYIGLFLAPDSFQLTDETFYPELLPVSEGLNEEGLSVASLWLNEAEIPSGENLTFYENSIQIQDLMGYLLGTCASVDDVKQKVQSLTVWVTDAMKSSALIHLAIHDEQGNSLVIEYLDGRPHLYDNSEIGVLANDPPLDWHWTNYSMQYAGLPVINSATDQLITIVQSDDVYSFQPNPKGSEVLGSGLIGLPGDYSSPSRFARTARLRNTFPDQYTAEEGVQFAWQAISGVRVPEQATAMRNHGGYNPTLWTVVRDHTNRILYWNTRMNASIRAVSLSSLDLSSGATPSFIPLESGELFEDRSAELE